MVLKGRFPPVLLLVIFGTFSTLYGSQFLFLCTGLACRFSGSRDGNNSLRDYPAELFQYPASDNELDVGSGDKLHIASEPRLLDIYSPQASQHLLKFGSAAKTCRSNSFFEWQANQLPPHMLPQNCAWKYEDDPASIVSYVENCTFFLRTKNGIFQPPDMYYAQGTQFVTPLLCRCCQKPKAATKVLRFAKLFPIVHSWSSAYYHFLVEVLPLFVVAEQGGHLDGAHLLLAGAGEPYILEAMQMFLGNTSFSFVERDATYQADEMLVPSFPACGRPRPDAVLWLRKVAMEKQLGNSARDDRFDTTRPILLIRRHGKRSVTNHPELLEALSRAFAGRVQEISLERMPLSSQMKAVQRASVFIGPHGAGMTNMLFLPRGSSVIEFVPDTYVSGVYCFLARVLGLPYWAVGANGTGTGVWTASMTVNVSEVVEAAILAERVARAF